VAEGRAGHRDARSEAKSDDAILPVDEREEEQTGRKRPARGHAFGGTVTTTMPRTISQTAESSTSPSARRIAGP
jgi:hypothetical protein